MDHVLAHADWPALSFAAGGETWGAVHLWTQIVGKIRMARAPAVNHWWHVTLYVTSRGLTTSPMPAGDHSFEIRFDFIAHELVVACSDGARERLPFRTESIADFQARLAAVLDRMGLATAIWTTPCEVSDPTPFAQDHRPRTYDPQQAQALWRALVQTDKVMQRFRGRWLGKTSPPHLFWGGFDLALTRFSGRRAPKHPSSPLLPDKVNWEAYSHEVASVGLWPGDPQTEPLFYAYAYPEPTAFRLAKVPAGARYDDGFGEFVLPYETVRQARDPAARLLDFFQATYEAAADLGHWPRPDLERPQGEWP